MAEVGPDDEIFTFAIARELEAYNFYLALAERVKDSGIRQLFEDLAKEELEHKAKLELEMMKIGEPVLVVDGEVRDSKHTYIISNEDSLLDMDYKDMLMLGMEKEEASFRTYINLLPTVHDEESREVLLAIAEEEVKHKLRFELEYDMLLKSK